MSSLENQGQSKRPNHEEEKYFFDLLNNYFNTNSKIGYLTFDVYQESPVEGKY